MCNRPECISGVKLGVGMIRRKILSALRYIESRAVYGQGKGYGTATIAEEVSAALQKVKRCPILAVDIGGNIGDYSTELRHRLVGLEIHVFEPSKSNIKILNSRFEKDREIMINPQAVAGSSGIATLFSDKPGSGLGSLTQRKLDRFGISFDCQEEVETIRFEDYWEQRLNSQPIGIVKVDIEGHEFDALHGFGRALCACDVIQFEFGGCNIDSRTHL